MEQFKSKTGKEIRLASTSGHVVIVGEKFIGVPVALEKEAMAAGLVPKSLYDEVKNDMAAELRAEAEAVKADEDAKVEAPDEVSSGLSEPLSKNELILGALKRIATEVGEGKENTEKGQKLIHNKKPVLAAVSEYAGCAVSNADIEEALK